MSRRGGLPVVVLLTLAVPAAGDEILTASRAKYASVRLEDVRGGTLYFRDVQGRVLSRSLADIGRLTISGWESFNRAEEALADKRYRQAAREYEALLASAGGAEPADARPRHRRELLLVRLIAALDGQGQFDDAVARWIELCGAWGEAAGGFAPRNVPGRQSALHAAAVASLETAVARAGDGPAAAPLRRYLETLRADPVPPAVATAPATKPAVAPRPLQASEEDGRLRQAARLVEEGKLDLARKMIDHAAAQATGERRAAWLYWRGRCLEAGAKDDADRMRAALEYMRVPIHFPADARAAECLYRTAMIHRQIGQADRVEPLIREAMSLSPSAELRRQCEAALATTPTTTRAIR